MGIDRSSTVRNVSLISTALVATEAPSGCSLLDSGYKYIEVDPITVIDTVANRFTMLNDLGQEVYQEPVTDLLQERISGGETVKLLQFNRDGTNIEMFFLDESYQVPSEDLLNDMWDFLEMHHNYNFLMLQHRRFVPVKNAVMFLGAFDIGHGFQSAATFAEKGNMMQPATVPRTSVVGLQDDSGIDPFATEFCQLMLAGADLKTQLNDDQEVLCNMFGIAAYASKSNMDYEEYAEMAKRDGYVVKASGGSRKILLEPYDEATYNYIKNNIFNKTETSSADKKYGLVRFVSDLVIKAKQIETSKIQVLIGIDEYLESIYDKNIQGNLRSGMYYAENYMKGVLI